MYKYSSPTPIIIDLCDQNGFKLRKSAAEYLGSNLNLTGAERGTKERQGFGVLAEIVIRNHLGLPIIKPKNHPLGYDILLPTNVNLDVKCRGGEKPFLENYAGEDGIPREAKHNFFARQVNDTDLNTDIYLMTHLERPNQSQLPGSIRQRKWKIYICGWVSKKRVLREGVYLPPGSLTERGRGWFPYNFHEIEFYNKNLNGLKDLKDLLLIDKKDVQKDENRKGGFNLTSVDTIRIVYDLIAHGVLNQIHLVLVKKEIKLNKQLKPILHPNQYYHLLLWFKSKGFVDNKNIAKALKIYPIKKFKGL